MVVQLVVMYMINFFSHCFTCSHSFYLILILTPGYDLITNSTSFNFGGYQLIKRDFDVPREPLPDAEKSTPANLNSEPPRSWFADSARKTLSKISQIAARKPQSCVQKPSEATLPSINDTSTITAIDSPKEVPTIVISTHTPPSTDSTAPTLACRLWTFIKPFITPPSISLILSLIIANIPTLKALFVKTPGVNMPQAPDQRPPLDFVMEIATFAGPTVPVIGMLLLGAALSRLSMVGLPKGFWKAAVMMAGLKLVVGGFLSFFSFVGSCCVRCIHDVKPGTTF